MREKLIQYLNSRTPESLEAFLIDWIAAKVPTRPEAEIRQFVFLFIEQLIRVPVFFDSRYNNALQSLLQLAESELNIKCVMRENNIIKYY